MSTSILDAHIHGHFALETTRDALKRHRVSQTALLLRHLPPSSDFLDCLEGAFANSGINVRAGNEIYCGLSGQAPRFDLIVIYGPSGPSDDLNHLLGRSEEGLKHYRQRAEHQAHVLGKMMRVPLDATTHEFANIAESHTEMLVAALKQPENLSAIIDALRKARQQLIEQSMYNALDHWLDHGDLRLNPTILRTIAKFYFWKLFGRGQPGYVPIYNLDVWPTQIRRAVHDGHVLLSIEDQPYRMAINQAVSHFELDGVCVTSHSEACLAKPESREPAISTTCADWLVKQNKLLLVGSDFDFLNRRPGIDPVTAADQYGDPVVSHIYRSFDQVFA